MKDNYKVSKYGLDFIITVRSVAARLRLYCVIPQLHNISILCNISHNVGYGYVLNLSRYIDIDANTQCLYCDDPPFIVSTDKNLHEYTVDGPVEEEWRQKLLNGYKLSKNVFSISKEGFNKSVYYMSTATIYQYTPDIDTTDAYNIYTVLKDFRYATKSVSIGSITTRVPEFLIKSNVYEKLPDKWTVYDLRDIVKSELESTRRIKERIWYELGQTIQAGQSWKIPVAMFSQNLPSHILLKDGRLVRSAGYKKNMDYEKIR